MFRRAFTLIELLVAISIVGLLSSVVLASLNSARDKARTAAIQQFNTSIHNALGADLVGMWNLEEGPSGTMALDLSGHGNNGTIVGATWSSGLAGGQALEFDGVNDWINGVTQPKIQTSPNKFTIVGLINPDNQSSRFITPDSNGIDQWIGYDAGSGRIDVRIAQSADTNERSRTSKVGSVPVGAWTHFAVSIDDKNIKIYINGTLDSEFNETIDIANWSGNWRIGQRGNSADWYKGKMDYLRVYANTLALQ